MKMIFATGRSEEEKKLRLTLTIGTWNREIYPLFSEKYPIHFPR